MARTTLFTRGLMAFVTAGVLTTGCSASAPDKKPAGTLTLIGAVKEKVDDGTIKIEGETDNVPPP